jgi:hypothetical protein
VIRQPERIMDSVSSDFYVEDEPEQDAARAWKSGEPVIVVPSSLRRRLSRRLAHQAREFQHQVAEELRRIGAAVASGHGQRRRL